MKHFFNMMYVSIVFVCSKLELYWLSTKVPFWFARQLLALQLKSSWSGSTAAVKRFVLATDGRLSKEEARVLVALR